MNYKTSFVLEKRWICVLLSLTNVTTAVEWPCGTYTLVKPKSGCPANWMEGWRYQDNEDSRSDNGIPYDYHFAGFQSGTVHWDEEDSRNKNDHDGILPTGVYGRNTDINYCCREDGSYTTNIPLPTSQPFYLLRFTSPCQMVRGMYVREEDVHFDDEDHNNKNSASGKHPMGTGNVRNQNLMYCYYTPLQA